MFFGKNIFHLYKINVVFETFLLYISDTFKQRIKWHLLDKKQNQITLNGTNSIL